MTIKDLVALSFVFLAMLYISWHLGRYYEFNHAQSIISQAFWSESFDTDYLIPEDFQYGGEWASGRCLTAAGSDAIEAYALR